MTAEAQSQTGLTAEAQPQTGLSTDKSYASTNLSTDTSFETNTDADPGLRAQRRLATYSKTEAATNLRTDTSLETDVTCETARRHNESGTTDEPARARLQTDPVLTHEPSAETGSKPSTHVSRNDVHHSDASVARNEGRPGVLRDICRGHTGVVSRREPVLGGDRLL